MFAGAAVILAVLGFPLAMSAMAHRMPVFATSDWQLAEIAPTAGWELVASRREKWAPKLHRPAGMHTRSFSREGQRVDVHIGLFANQSRDSKLVNSLHRLAGAETPAWTQFDSGRELAEFMGRPLRMNTALLGRQDEQGQGTQGQGSHGENRHIRVWQWYWVDGGATGSGAMTKAWQLRSLLGGGSDASAWVAIASESQYPELLPVFLRDMEPSLERALKRTTAF